MRHWTDRHSKIVVDKNFSFSLGPETFSLNYKLSEEETLHSIEIRTGDIQALKNTIKAIEKELESTDSEEEPETIQTLTPSSPKR